MAFDPARWFVQHIGHPLWLRYKQESDVYRFYSNFAALWRAEREMMEQVQLLALKNILQHAGRNSPYYREVFRKHRFDSDSLNSCDDIRALPFVTKKDLNERMTEILSESFHREQLTEASTGGSSGQPLTFYRDKMVTLVRRAQDFLFNSLIGIVPGVRRAWVWGSGLDAFSMKSLKAKTMNFLTERAIYFYSFDATARCMRDFLMALNRHRPQVIFAYPNMLTALAEFAQQEGLAITAVPRVVTTAEPLYDFQRRLFADVFGAQTYERYGSREFGTAAAQIDSTDGLYLFEPSYHFEVVDPEGNAVPDGDLGELVITDFWNHAMPLIRYRTGDMVRMEPSSGRCGHWRRLREVGGRVVDLLVRPDGSRIAGQAVINLLRTAGVRSKVQVVQNAPDRLTIKHLRGEELSRDLIDELQRRADELFRAEMTIVFEAHDKLNHDQSGKYRYVTSECS